MRSLRLPLLALTSLLASTLGCRPVKSARASVLPTTPDRVAERSRSSEMFAAAVAKIIASAELFDVSKDSVVARLNELTAVQVLFQGESVLTVGGAAPSEGLQWVFAQFQDSDKPLRLLMMEAAFAGGETTLEQRYEMLRAELTHWLGKPERIDASLQAIGWERGRVQFALQIVERTNQVAKNHPNQTVVVVEAGIPQADVE